MDNISQDSQESKRVKKKYKILGLTTCFLFTLLGLYACNFEETPKKLIGDEGAFGGGGSGLTLSGALENKGLSAIPSSSSIIATSNQNISDASPAKKRWYDFIINRVYASSAFAPPIIEMLKGWNVIDYFFDRNNIEDILADSPGGSCPGEGATSLRTVFEHNQSSCEALGNMSGSLLQLVDVEQCILSRVPENEDVFEVIHPAAGINFQQIYSQQQNDKIVALNIEGMGVYLVKIIGRDNFPSGYEFRTQFCERNGYDLEEMEEDGLPSRATSVTRVNTQTLTYERFEIMQQGSGFDNVAFIENNDASVLDSNAQARKNYIKGFLRVINNQIVFDISRNRYIYEKSLRRFEGMESENKIGRTLEVTEISSRSGGGRIMTKKMQLEQLLAADDLLCANKCDIFLDKISADYRANELYNLSFDEGYSYKRLLFLNQDSAIGLDPALDINTPPNNPAVSVVWENGAQESLIRWQGSRYERIPLDGQENLFSVIPEFSDDEFFNVSNTTPLSEYPFYLDFIANLNNLDQKIYDDPNQMLAASSGGRIFHFDNVGADNQYLFNEDLKMDCSDYSMDPDEPNYPDIVIDLKADQFDGGGELRFDGEFAQNIFIPCSGVDDLMKPLSSVCTGRYEENADIASEGLPYPAQWPNGVSTDDYLYPSIGALTLMSVEHTMNSPHIEDTPANRNERFACDHANRSSIGDLTAWLIDFAGDSATLASPCHDDRLCPYED